MSLVDVGELVRDSPDRARSLLTVLAAISSARCYEAPLLRSLCLMCSYCRARFVPFFTPLGGIFIDLLGLSLGLHPGIADRRTRKHGARRTRCLSTNGAETSCHRVHPQRRS
jgi:hypothetical protein